MLPDVLAAFHQALRLGPGSCPPGLFEGTVPHIVRGLKAHAGNVGHARHLAIEETYPRLARHMGAESFHAAAERFLDDERVLGRSLDMLGEGFAPLLSCPVERDMARAEWAWLEAFHAGDAEPLSLSELGRMDPAALVGASLALHPAVRCVELEAPLHFAWPDPLQGDGNFLLVTRPHAEVLIRRVGAALASIVGRQAMPGQADELLETQPEPLLALIEAGAIQMEDRP